MFMVVSWPVCRLSLDMLFGALAPISGLHSASTEVKTISFESAYA